MKRDRVYIFILSLVFLTTSLYAAGNSEDFPVTYPATTVLKKALINLGLKSKLEDTAIQELDSLAKQNKGFNSLYEIKRVAQELGLKTQALKTNLEALRLFLQGGGQIIANITANHYFSLVENIDTENILVYIPLLNESQLLMSHEEFLADWDNTALFISKKEITLGKSEVGVASVANAQFQTTVAAIPCSNVKGGGNGPGAGDSGPSDDKPTRPTTKEPVVIHNGNLFLISDDIFIPSRGLPLNLKRHYNAQVVSEVEGWTPEPGAGSWVIEEGEYSGQGDRSVSNLKFKDFVLELDMQTIQPGGNGTWETGWVNIRYSEDPQDRRRAKESYYFLIHTDGTLELTKWQDNREILLSNKPSNHNPLNKNRIKIQANGANIKVYVNGSLEIDHTDGVGTPLLAEGKIALESFFSHTHFDNIRISSEGKTYTYDFNQDDNEFIFGYGWTHSYSLRIKEEADQVILYQENNAREIYLLQTDGSYKSTPINYYSKLTKDTLGFSLKTKHGLHYRFNSLGKLLYIEDRNLNRTSLTYKDSYGKELLSSITEPAGRKISLEYWPNQMVKRATDPAGNYWEYFYNTQNHLIKAVDPNGNTTNYTYDSLTHNLTELTDPEANTYKYTYTYNDRVNYQLDPLKQKTSFDYLGDTVHIINQRGQVYKYNFDQNQFLEALTNPRNSQERAKNDADGNILEYTDHNGNLTTFTYDSRGNKTTITDPKNNLTRITYELDYNLLSSITDAKGNQTAFSYDAKGNLRYLIDAEGGTTINTYNTSGQLLSTKDPKGSLSRFEYDAYGNLSTKIDAQGNTTTYTYDILGRLSKVTDSQGNSTAYTYDKSNNLISVKDALGNFTLYTYTKNDKISAVTEPLGNTTKYSYDCFANLLSVTDSQGHSTTYTYDTANQMHLDKANLLKITDAAGNKTTYTYNTQDQLTKVTDATDQSTQFEYDSQGNLTRRTDAEGVVTNYRYNSLNRLYSLNTPELYTEYTLDALGNILQIKDNHRGPIYSRTYTYTYDKVNRPKTQNYSEADGTRLDYAYTYDLNGNRTSLAISGFGKTYYEYDSLSRMNKITAPGGKTLEFSYDSLSRRTQLKYPNGTNTTYTYDNLGRLTSLSNKDKSAKDISKFSYTYDKNSRRTRMDSLTGSLNYTYDSLGQLTAESGSLKGKNISSTYTYDSLGNRTSLFQDNLLTEYTYNNLSQLLKASSSSKKSISVKGTIQDTSPVSMKVNGITASVSGNEFLLEKLPLEPGLNTIQVEAQDAAGNITSKRISLSYNPTKTLPPATYYSYDRNGNLISRQNSQNTESFAYDAENRISSYENSSGRHPASYTYNGQGKRVAKNTVPYTSYYYEGDNLILEKGSNSESLSYLHGPKLDELLLDSRGYSYHYDGLGSVVNLTDSQGKEIANYSYDSFGGMRSQSGSVSNPWLFTGRQFDQESGLYYYRNRYYDPGVGRFTTRDPAGFVDGPNLYGYVKNNPLNFIDPFGLDTYYINYELFTSNPDPTNNPISHSYVATTDNGVVTDTYSWGNNSEGRWFHNNPVDMSVAQRAIDSGIGTKRYGGESLDYHVTLQYQNRQNDTGRYDAALNNCKENTARFLRDARNQQRREGRNNKGQNK